MSEYFQRETQQRPGSRQFATGRSDSTNENKKRDDDSSELDRDDDRKSYIRRDEDSSSGQGSGQQGGVSQRSWEDPEKGWSR